MKIRHKVPFGAARPPTITPEYQAEVDRATNASEKRHRDAQRRLANAETKLTRLRTASPKPKPADLAVARALVELRRAELEALERMMHAAPASAQHRGISGHRPVPTTRGSLL